MTKSEHGKHTDLWESVLNKLGRKLTASVLEEYFANSYIADKRSKTLYLRFENQTITDAVKKLFAKDIRTITSEVLGTPISIKFMSCSDSVGAKQQLIERELKQIQSPFKRIFTFDSFAAGKSNSMAYRAAQEFCKDPTNPQMNPLLFVSPYPDGKTHLLCALTNALQNQGVRAVYINIDRLTTKFTEASQKKTVRELRELFDAADCLLVDDLQLLEDKHGSSKFFLNIANDFNMYERGLALCSTKPIRDLQVSSHLKARLNTGLEVQISSNGPMTRRGIYHKILQRTNISLSEEIIETIVEQRNLRLDEAIAIINKFASVARLNQEDVTVEYAEQIIKNYIADRKISVTPETVIKTVAEHLDIPLEQIQSSNRQRPVVLARYIAAYSIKSLCSNITLAEIAVKLSQRNRQTVETACRRIETLQKTDSNVKKCVNEIEDKIQNK